MLILSLIGIFSIYERGVFETTGFTQSNNIFITQVAICHLQMH